MKIFLLICLTLFSYIVQAESTIPITVYRSPTCGCCGKWIEHLRQNNFIVTDVLTNEMESVKKRHGVTNDIASCHTAVTSGYVIEGHVPAKDIRALLKARPNVFGIAVPGMPENSPGMEQAHTTQVPTNFGKSYTHTLNAQHPNTLSPTSFNESINKTTPSCFITR